MTPLEQTKTNQRIAADPARSAIVMANAGAGKTRVLTNRVARLLLNKTPPEKILCITFTKAAAAEMAERLFTELGQWAMFDDDKLAAALVEIEGTEAPNRARPELDDARRLFAKALETPGGLKIQTIHSFCESVLRRFPLEANVPPGFTIVEESEAARLLGNAINAVAQRSNNDPALAACFRRLSKLRTEKELRALLASVSGAKFDAERARYDSLIQMTTALASSLGADPTADEGTIRKSFMDTLDSPKLEEIRDALNASGINAQKYGAKPIHNFQNAGTDLSKWNALRSLFLKTDGTPRKKYGDKKTEKIAPWVNDFLVDLENQFVNANNALKTDTLFRDTAAFYHILSDIRDDYRHAKSMSAALDFDDLIERTRSLFAQTSSTWVMYKLDQGIDHILVDEAQDTSPGQWAVITALLEDHLGGAGARDTNRTFFAVGDMKQSIYSFQGADVELFEEKEITLGKRLAARGDYKNVDLQLSFRTTAPVLQFVDALFENSEAAEGLGHRGVPAHGVKRIGEAGLVELWPLTPRPEKLETNPWDKPVDTTEANHPIRKLSEHIASQIKAWLDKKSMLESHNRPIEPGDIMILVQSRSQLFDEVIRQLAQHGVPVAGADRLKLLEDPAVEDLLSFAKFAVLTADDLSLAEILKSPLFGFDDDHDLFPLAYERANNQSLWAALNQRSTENPRWGTAVEMLSAARTIGLRQGPFAFFAHILETGTQSGRKRLYERLSESSRDAVDEMLRQALDFENANPRSMRAFINWFEDNGAEIKREMDRADNAVRVMTVHGSKGLESNIVFLIDAHRGPNLNAKDPLQTLKRDQDKPTFTAPIFTGSSNRDIPATAVAREYKKQKAYEEYRRLLYVAATRARDRLYICGYELGNTKNPREKPTNVKSWHALAQDAFGRLESAVEKGPNPFWDGQDQPWQRISCAQSAIVEDATSVQSVSPSAPPDWLHRPAQAEIAKVRLQPSRMADDDEAASEPSASPALSPSNTDTYFRGRTLHRLLELLPDIAPDLREESAKRLLLRLAPEIDEAERNRWCDEILTVLGDKQFSRVFGPGSRAEVGIAGTPKGSHDHEIINGQIDRLIIDKTEILVVDYKTNRPPPERVDDVASAYVTQMAAYRALLQEIYPTHHIKSALLWTFDARLMPLPDSMLDQAFERWLKAG